MIVKHVEYSSNKRDDFNIDKISFKGANGKLIGVELISDGTAMEDSLIELMKKEGVRVIRCENKNSVKIISKKLL